MWIAHSIQETKRFTSLYLLWTGVLQKPEFIQGFHLILNMQFLINILEMFFYGFRADGKPYGNFLIKQALRHLFKHFLFTLAQ